MLCPVWNNLYEQYEKATLKRIASIRNNFLVSRSRDLELLNVEVSRALRELHEHERQHQCR
jgi:hypothetical protein